MTFEIIAALMLTAIVIDFFWDSNAIVGLVAILITAVWTTSKLDVSWMWYILTLILVTGVLGVVYWHLMQMLRMAGIKRMEGKAAWIDTGSGAVGKVGKVRLINDQLMIYWNGDLWPATTDKTLCDGDVITILSFEDGKFTV